MRVRRTPKNPPGPPLRARVAALPGKKSLSPSVSELKLKVQKSPDFDSFSLRNDQPYSELGSDLVRFEIDWAVRRIAKQMSL